MNQRDFNRMMEIKERGPEIVDTIKGYVPEPGEVPGNSQRYQEAVALETELGKLTRRFTALSQHQQLQLARRYYGGR